MGKNITIICLFSFLFTSCSIDWSDTKTQKITELEKQITELKNSTSSGMTVFEKRTRCASLAPDIQAKIDALGETYPNLGKFSIGGVFYSPVKDVCLWIRLTNTYAPDGSPLERRALYQYGDDFGSTEPIIGCEQITSDKRGINACEKWDTELMKFKGEDISSILNP